MKGPIIVLILCFSLPFSVIAQEAEKLVASILESGLAKETYLNSVEAIIELKRQNYPNVEEEFWPRLQAKVDRELAIDSLVTEVYKRSYTVAELKEIEAFCSSPTGKKWIKEGPQVDQAVLQLIATHTDRLGAALLEQIQKEKLDLMTRSITGCSEMQTGKFFSQQDAALAPVEFTRSKTEQTEVLVDGSERKFAVNWLTECRYTLRLMEEDGSIDPETKALRVNIYALEKNTYQYAAQFEDGEQIFQGLVEKIK